MIKKSRNTSFIGMKIDALLAKQLKEQAYLSSMTLTELVEEILQGWVIDQIEDYEYKTCGKSAIIDCDMYQAEKVIDLWVEQKCGAKNITKIISA